MLVRGWTLSGKPDQTDLAEKGVGGKTGLGMKLIWVGHGWHADDMTEFLNEKPLSPSSVMSANNSTQIHPKILNKRNFYHSN